MQFHEFLYGLAALDSTEPRSRFRAFYVFRFYDQNSDGLLDESELGRLLSDIRHKTNQVSNPDAVKRDVELILSKYPSRRLDEKTLSTEVAEGRFANLHYLFHANRNIREEIHARLAYENIVNKYGEPFGDYLIGTCVRCRPKKYTLAYHMMKLNSQGHPEELRPLTSMPCGEVESEVRINFYKRAVIWQSRQGQTRFIIIRRDM